MYFRAITIWFFLTGLVTNTFTQPPVNHWELVVDANDTWHYFIGMTSGPVSGWQGSEFDDSDWPSGRGGFGYGDRDDSTSFPVPPNPLSVFARISFNMADTSQILKLALHMDYDDGFVAWINGMEVARSNLGTPGDLPSYNTPASDHEAVMWRGEKPPCFILSKAILKSCLLNGTNLLAVQVNNSGSTSSDLSCISFLSAGLKTTQQVYRPEPEWFTDPFTGFEGSNLPLVSIETNGQLIIPNEKVTVDLAITDNGTGNLNRLSDIPNVYLGKAGIEYRGSSSLGFPKKNYSFELRTVSGGDSANIILDMPAESDWILQGPYSDKTLMRNYLAYNMFRAMGHYAVRTRFCELFVDGQYMGLYVLMEKIKRDAGRLPIAKLDSTDVSGLSLTGGYIVKIDYSSDGTYTDGWFSPFIGTGTSGGSPFFALYYPKPENLQSVQRSYIQYKISTFESTLQGDNYLNNISGYRSLIDLTSFLDYFILVEMSKNTDGYRLSAFLYKDRDDRDPKIHMGPVWDYDFAFGNADYLDAFNTAGWNYSIQANGWGTPFWWSRMMTDPIFVNQLNCRWNELRNSIFSNDSLISYIDSYITAMGDAVERNFELWSVHGQYIWPNYFVGNNFEEDINFMKNWILERVAWMDENMPGIDCTTENPDEYKAASFTILAKPNPGIGHTTIEIQNPLQQDLQVKIISLLGQVVNSFNIDGAPVISKEIAIQQGVYYLRVASEKEIQSLKIVIQ